MNATRTSCDRAFSTLVRARAGRCEKCARPGGLDATFLPTAGLECAHIISRSNSQVRCDFDNAMALCTRCHAHFTRHPEEWRRFVIETIGQDRYDALVAKARALHHPDWPAIRTDLNRQLVRLRPAA